MQTAYEAWLDDNEEAATRTRKLLASRMQRMTAGTVDGAMSCRFGDRVQPRADVCGHGRQPCGMQCGLPVKQSLFEAWTTVQLPIIVFGPCAW